MQAERRSACSAQTLSVANLWLTVATIAFVHITVPAVAPAQSVSGAMAVSATVLPPDGARSPELISVSVARPGIARLETRAPTAATVSQIVMVTLSSPTSSFPPMVQDPTLVPATRRRNAWGAAPTPGDTSVAPRLSYEVHVGRPSLGPNAVPISVRVSYLIVPGGT